MSDQVAPHRPHVARAEVRQRTQGGFSVTLDGAEQTPVPSVPHAITVLCAEALRQRRHIAVEVSTFDGRRHLAVDHTGRVRDAAPPAPDSPLPDPASLRSSATRRDLAAPGLVPAWPGAAPAAPVGPPPRTRRRWFSRR